MMSLVTVEGLIESLCCRLPTHPPSLPTCLPCSLPPPPLPKAFTIVWTMSLVTVNAVLGGKRECPSLTCPPSLPPTHHPPSLPPSGLHHRVMMSLVTVNSVLGYTDSFAEKGVRPDHVLLYQARAPPLIGYESVLPPVAAAHFRGPRAHTVPAHEPMGHGRTSPSSA